jgi:tetratricopeptide (TPR) repeat protein
MKKKTFLFLATAIVLLVVACNKAAVQKQATLKNAEGYHARGPEYLDNGDYDYDNAIADFTQAINLDPDNVYAYNGRGFAYSIKGDYDNAIADYTQAIKLNPDDPTAYYFRGLAYRDKGDYDRAITDFTHVIRLDPNDAEVYTNRGVAYDSKGDHNRAIADYETALRLDPNDSYTQQRLEDARQARGR